MSAVSNVVKMLTLLAFLPLILAASPPTGYTTAPMTFRGKIQGIEVEYQGSIEEVMHQFEKEHTGLKFNHGLSPPADHSALSTGQVDAAQSALYCCPVASWDWGPASVAEINSGITNLYAVDNSSDSWCGVPAHSCSLFTCVGNSAIWVCNDQNDKIQTLCGIFADTAKKVIEGCQHDGLVCGQKFWEDSTWNIITRYDRC